MENDKEMGKEPRSLLVVKDVGELDTIFSEVLNMQTDANKLVATSSDPYDHDKFIFV